VVDTTELLKKKGKVVPVLNYLLDRRLGGPQSRSGRYGEVKILDPTGTRTPTCRPARSQSLYRVSYPDS
jgi:hypothetical protein